MKALLDTCALIWFLEDNGKNMPSGVMDLIEDETTQVHVSVASIWELAIKTAVGKLHLQNELNHSLRNTLEDQGFSLLDIQFQHAAYVRHLPPIHRDPFDRLMIAQCRIENLIAFTNDPHWSHPDYGIRTRWG